MTIRVWGPAKGVEVLWNTCESCGALVPRVERAVLVVGVPSMCCGVRDDGRVRGHRPMTFGDAGFGKAGSAYDVDVKHERWGELVSRGRG